MPLYFITGIAAAGKSACKQELASRGYTAFDTDSDAFARWQNKATGYIHPKHSVKPADRTEEFLENNDWVVPRRYVQLLGKRHAGETVFLCGVATNEEQLKDLFDKIFYLKIDEPTLLHRLKTRTTNDWGKKPSELAKTMTAFRQSLSNLSQHDYIIIDATKPVKIVADQVIKYTNAKVNS